MKYILFLINTVLFLITGCSSVNKIEGNYTVICPSSPNYYRIQFLPENKFKYYIMFDVGGNKSFEGTWCLDKNNIIILYPKVLSHELIKPFLNEEFIDSIKGQKIYVKAMSDSSEMPGQAVAINGDEWFITNIDGEVTYDKEINEISLDDRFYSKEKYTLKVNNNSNNINAYIIYIDDYSPRDGYVGFLKCKYMLNRLHPLDNNGRRIKDISFVKNSYDTSSTKIEIPAW